MYFVMMFLCKHFRGSDNSAFLCYVKTIIVNCHLIIIIMPFIKRYS